jgi:hypothetical protein
MDHQLFKKTFANRENIVKFTIAGAGYHVKDLSEHKLETMLKLIKTHEFMYVLAIPPPKIAILCLYQRLFRGRATRVVIYCTGVLIMGTCMFGVIASFANCRPFSSFWHLRGTKQCTMDVMVVFRYYSIPNITADVIILLIPLPALRKLQVGIMTKVGVYLTFLSLAL